MSRATKPKSKRLNQSARLPATDKRVQELLTDKQKEKLNENRTIAVEVSDIGGKQVVTRAETSEKAIDRPLRDFKLSLDEDELMSSLELHPADSKWGRLYQALSIPGMTFIKAIKQESISLLELNTFWHDSRQQMGMIRMMNHLPEVMEQTAVRAKDKLITCGKCEGRGFIYKEEREVKELDGKLKYGEPELVRKQCPECVDSTLKGKVVEPGDFKSREMVFKAAGIMNDGVNVNVNNQTLTFNGIEHEVSNIGKILEARQPRVEIPEKVESFVEAEEISNGKEKASR